MGLQEQLKEKVQMVFDNEGEFLNTFLGEVFRDERSLVHGFYMAGGQCLVLINMDPDGLAIEERCIGTTEFLDWCDSLSA